MGKTVDYRPRAAHYAPPAALELQKAGVLDDVTKRGFNPEGVCWRRFNGEYLAGVDMAIDKEDPLRMVVLPLGMLGEVLVNHVGKHPSIKVYWDHEVIAVSETDGGAQVTAKSPEGDKTFKGDYVVGCDGANSKVRRALFGDWNYPGKTWDEWVVATNVSPPFPTCLISGVLSLREIRLYRFQLYHRPRGLVHGRQDHSRWPVASVLRRTPRSHP